MNSPFADDLVDELDPVENMKIVAVHLMFLYAQERQIAEQEGRKADEDYFYAAANLYNYAAVTQILIEDEEFDD